MDKVITATDIAKRDGLKSHREWIRKLSIRMNKKNQIDTPFTEKIKRDAEPAIAEINHGRWIAICPACGCGSEYVEPEEKIFYCFSCGNYAIGGAGRRVQFPMNREAVEIRTMSNAVVKNRGGNYIDREFLAEPVCGARNWKPKDGK